MLVSTIPTLEGQRIARYCGVMAGEKNSMLMVTASGTAVVIEAN